jgi:YHS domain-containing protein
MAVDPVCGMHVDENAARPKEQYTSTHAGQTYRFCSHECKDKSIKLPSSTLASRPEVPARRQS